MAVVTASLPYHLGPITQGLSPMAYYLGPITLGDLQRLQAIQARRGLERQCEKAIS